MRKLAFVALAATSLLALGGCGTVLSVPSLVSMAATVFGGVANGAIFGGSVISALRPVDEEIGEERQVSGALPYENAQFPSAMADFR